MAIWPALSAFVHLIAMAMWLGGMVFFLVVSGPAVHDLEPEIAVKTMNQARVGLENVAWIAIGLLLLTGMTNLIARVTPTGSGFSRAFIILLSVKIILFAAMVVHHCLQVFKYAPAISGLTAQLPRGLDAWPEPLLSQWRRWFLLLKINAALGPIAVLLGLALVQN
jgi:putative copper export protein